MSARFGETTHLRLTMPILRTGFIGRSVPDLFGLATGLAFRFVVGGDSCSQELGDFGTRVADLIYRNYVDSVDVSFPFEIVEDAVIDFRLGRRFDHVTFKTSRVRYYRVFIGQLLPICLKPIRLFQAPVQVKRTI